MGHGPGTLLDQRYRLIRAIGDGSHGLVYEARDETTGQPVAVKLLHESTSDPEYCVRLVREAKAMAALAGTHAVKIHGYGADDDGSFYLAMELLEGTNFEERIWAVEREGQRISVQETVEVLSPIVDTLEIAHSRGIAHRDLKPSNVYIVSPSRGGGVRLLDFGLVKVKGAKQITQMGTIAGSPNYIAPEAWRGDSSTLDHRVDVYSFAVIVYRALAGQVPFPGDDMLDKLEKVMTAARPSLHALRPDLPKRVDDWLEHAMAILAEDRFFTIRASWNALLSVLR